MSRARSVALTLAVLALVAGVAVPAPAQHGNTAGYAWDDPAWRFSHHERPVKVVLVAGSIGAFRDRPYGRLLHQWCSEAEIRNISRVGLGAPQLLRHFQESVLENPNVPVGSPGVDMWLLFGGGMNSVGLPQRTHRAMRTLFQQAHRRRVRVVALTLTPWGADGDRDPRWAGANGLRALDNTRRVVDFVLGRLGPRAALGSHVAERYGVPAEAPWHDEERPDVAIDVYDSPLRDADARPWPLAEARRALERDGAYRASLAALPEASRAAQIEADARRLSLAPQWFLRREYRGFDHIHLNRAGHEVLAQTICPRLPESWGCACPGS